MNRMFYEAISDYGFVILLAIGMIVTAALIFDLYRRRRTTRP
ncbi:EYxxD motif small membrane protein [Thermoflavimicrobium dichotomicum]|uniref:Uncharacterized protein n=1 Tax=Thermoflavimicrobium dichotomicum TaxID=46223 RepID=A0A1I3JFS5_9BACL|nr:EYxxD motif small membrane protein [Thermoflavimicrobium dichotomicum]SFI59132.1 hypothetical protein SAMN05421852_10161 [Thermoflavimicrobium dichotomicum]